MANKINTGSQVKLVRLPTPEWFRLKGPQRFKAKLSEAYARDIRDAGLPVGASGGAVGLVTNVLKDGLVVVTFYDNSRSLELPEVCFELVNTT